MPRSSESVALCVRRASTCVKQGAPAGCGSGRGSMIGGRDDSPPDDIHYSPYAEIYTPGYGFRTLTGAYIDTFNITSLYPRSWLTSNGDIWTSSDGTGLVYAINTEGSGSVEQIVAEQENAQQLVGVVEQVSREFCTTMALFDQLYR